MDRPRTRTLQPKRRTSQQHTNARTLGTTTLTNSASITVDDKTKGQTERDQRAKQNADQQDEDHKHDPAASATPAKHNNASRTRFGKHGARDKPETKKQQDQTTLKAQRTEPTVPPGGGAPSQGADRPPVRGLASAEGSKNPKTDTETRQRSTTVRSDLAI